MLKQKENIRPGVIDSVFIVLFLFFALSLNNGQTSAAPKAGINGINNENIIIQHNAIIFSDNMVVFHQKSWVSDFIYPVAINPGKYSIRENRKTANKISIQDNAIKKAGLLPVFFFNFHFCTAEKDDIPFIT